MLPWRRPFNAFLGLFGRQAIRPRRCGGIQTQAAPPPPPWLQAPQDSRAGETGWQRRRDHTPLRRRAAACQSRRNRNRGHVLPCAPRRQRGQPIHGRCESNKTDYIWNGRVGAGSCVQPTLPIGQRWGIPVETPYKFRRGGDPYGNRTRVSGVRGRRPGPLDEGAARKGRIMDEGERKSSASKAQADYWQSAPGSARGGADAWKRRAKRRW